MSDPMPGGAGVPPPLRPLPWLAGALAAAALLAAVDPGPTPVDAGAVTGSIELGGGGSAQGVADGSGSLTLGGSADPRAEPAGSGSLSLGGSGAAQAVAAPAGSLTLGGSAAASAEPAAAGSLDLGGTGAASASAVSAGSIVLGGTGLWTAVAGGSLDLGGTGSGTAEPVAAGSLILAGSGTPSGSVVGAGSLTLGGTATGQARPTSAGSLTFGGTGAPTGRAAGTGSITLGGSATGVKLGVLGVWDGSNWKVIGCGGHGATGTSLFTDPFTRADSASGGVGNGWVYCGVDFNPAPYSGTSKPDDWQILSNQAYCPTHTYLGTLAEGKLKGIVQSTLTADFDMTVTARTTYASGAGSATGLAFRRNTANGSFLWWTPDAVYYYNSSGAQSTFDTFTISLASGDQLRIVGTGTTVLFYKNGVLQHTGSGYTTNNTATCTQHGLMNSQSFTSAAIWDDFTLTDPAAIAATTGRLKLWDGTQWVREACDSDPGTPFTDDFGRTIGTLLNGNNGWAGDANWTINASNRAQNFATGFATRPLSRDTTVTSGSVEAFLVATDLFHSPAGLFVRSNSGFTQAVYLALENGGITLYDMNSFAVISHLDTVTRATFTGTLRLDWTATTLTAYLNGVPFSPVSNSAHASNTYAGFVTFGPTNSFDDWSSPPLSAVVSRPLYVWTGTAWDRVACLVPA